MRQASSCHPRRRPGRGAETATLFLSVPAGVAALASALARFTITTTRACWSWRRGVLGDEGGRAAIPVTRSGQPGRRGQRGLCTSDLTATASVDYAASAGTLTFPRGVALRQIFVSTTANTLFDRAHFRIALAAP